MHPLEYYLSAIVLNLFGALFFFIPVNTEKIVYISARENKPSGNLLSILREYTALHPEYTHVSLFRTYSYSLIGKLSYLLYLVRAVYHLQTARVVFLDNAFFPVHVVAHKKKTTVIQVWHATGVFKKFGNDVSPDERKVENRFLHKRYDYVVADSEATRRVYAGAFGIPYARTLPFGSPRTDFFFDSPAMASSRNALHGRFPELKGKKVVLYAPTFRGFGKMKTSATNFDAAALGKALGPGFAIVYKPHSVSHENSKTGGYDIVLEPEENLNEFFTVTDALVTDYSSALFEFAFLQKPIFKLCDDFEEYSAYNGLYIDYHRDIVGREVLSVDGIAKSILSPEEGLTLSPHERLDFADFTKKYCGYSDGHSTKRLVEFAESQR